MATTTDNLGPDPGPTPTLLCPGCGYDLRAATEDRCSECGLVIDRAQLDRSGFPWAHRKAVGRFRAFAKTVRLVMLDSPLLRLETAKKQSPRDAAVFRGWVAATLAVSFAIVAIMVLSDDVLQEVAVVEGASRQFASLSRGSGFEQDLMVPWSAGITPRPALFVYAAALAAYFVGATRPVFRVGGRGDDYADAVDAISAYVVAPLVLLLPAMVGYATLFWMDHQEDYDFGSPPLVVIVWVLGVCSFVLFLMAVGGTVFRTGQWRARTAHAGYPTGFLAMGELLLRWAVGGVVLLGVVPWCVGFVWIVFDSFLD